MGSKKGWPYLHGHQALPASRCTSACCSALTTPASPAHRCACSLRACHAHARHTLQHAGRGASQGRAPRLSQQLPTPFPPPSPLAIGLYLRSPQGHRDRSQWHQDLYPDRPWPLRHVTTWDLSQVETLHVMCVGSVKMKQNYVTSASPRSICARKQDGSRQANQGPKPDGVRRHVLTEGWTLSRVPGITTADFYSPRRNQSLK